MFAMISEKDDSARAHLISFILQLCGAEQRKDDSCVQILQRTALSEGLHQFIEERYLDLKCDVPKLPKILREELLPALGKQVLTEAEVTAFKEQIDTADASED
jgi:hypothetical protein